MSDDPDDRSDETRSGLPEITRKLLTLGLGAYFLGEDAIKRAVKETKLPRDIVTSVVSNASKGKEELFGFVARELSSFLRQMDVQAELSRFASTHKIRLNAEIEFIPKNPKTVETAPAAPAAASPTPDEAEPRKTPRPRARTPSEIGPMDPGVRLNDLGVSLESRETPPEA